MQRSTTPLPLAVGALAAFALAGAVAHAGEKHVHGHAALEVAVDGDRLLLNFTSPLDSLVGFEHAPRTDKQKDAVRRMTAELNNAVQQFVPTAEARCTPEPVTLASGVIEPSLLGGAASGKHGHENRKRHDGHAELQATFVFRCAQPAKLSSLEVRLFDAFRGLTRIDVQVAGARRQAAARLTPKSRRVTW